MPSGFTQDNRFLKLTTPVGTTKLLIESFSISERISDTYEMEIECLVPVGETVTVNQLLGQVATVSVALDHEWTEARHFSGIIREVHVLSQDERFQGYRLSVVPSMWLMNLSQNYRVFEKKKAPDILQEVFAEYGFQVTPRLDATYTEWDLCTQYRESDFHFVSRLMEHEGIFYFFEFGSGSHTLILGDSPTAYRKCPQQSTFRYAPEVGPGEEDWFGAWDQGHQLRTGSYRLWDWHMENATRFESGVNTATAIANNTALKISEFTGQFTHQFNEIDSVSKAPTEASKMSRLRMEEVETENPLHRGSGAVRALSCGHRFNLDGTSTSGEYVITSVQHSGMQHPPYTYGEFEAPLTYNSDVTCIKYGAVYRPARRHKKPVVQGPQTAIVTERPDKYGRVRVKYHWGTPQPQSAWVRVVQKWAGPQYGAIFIPRPDHEVVIEFVDGDPDQPILTGCVYSATNMPPYTLPDNFTQSGIKTRSLTSGGDGGSEEFNELRFEDKQGSEDIYFHAQKDFHRVVENNDDLRVGNNQTINIYNNRTEVVEEGNEKVTIKKGNRDVILDMGNDKHHLKMGNRDVVLDMGNDTLHLKMGNQTTKIDLGKSETEAMQSIELKVGQSSIKLDQMGVTIKGMMIKCEAQIQMESKALLYKADGTAMVQIKGGITMIN
ncbi:MAG TPA: type VI secretion system tip protein TssI/VgrG [Bryobacteraceae bacterium]|nr:type VI secretion system tip protein TssI/VgrG [Bryobacteraceae bacterium]